MTNSRKNVHSKEKERKKERKLISITKAKKIELLLAKIFLLQGKVMNRML